MLSNLIRDDGSVWPAALPPSPVGTGHQTVATGARDAPAVVVLTDHAFRIGHEVGRHVAALELHTLDDNEVVGDSLGLLHCDHSLAPHATHRCGDQVAYLLVATGGDGGYRGKLRVLHLLGHDLELFNQRSHRLVDTSCQLDWVDTRSHDLHALINHRLRKDGGCGGAITGLIVGVLCCLAHQPRPHVLHRVLQVNLLGHSHAVVDDAWGAKLGIEHDVAALGAESHTYDLGQFVHTRLHLAQAAFLTEVKLLGHGLHLNAVLAAVKSPAAAASRSTRQCARSADGSA
eukprot:scaffold306_cov525-Prasinococcus_capsulatus_cf.AAC.40